MAPFSSNDDDDLDPLEKASNWASRFFGAAAQASIRAATPEDAKFFKAVESNKIPEMLACLKSGTDPNTFSLEGLTALHVAARRNLPKMVEALINNGAHAALAKKDEPDCLPLSEALAFDRPEIVRLLAAHGGAPMKQDSLGWTPVHHAIQQGKTGIMKAFLDAGIDGNVTTKNGATPLLAAISHNQNDIISLLLEQDDVAAGICTYFVATNEEQRTAFHWAINKGKTNIVQRMIDLGALLNTPDAKGMTPLGLAIDIGNKRIVQMLLKAGADVNKTGAGSLLPLHFAAGVEDVSSDIHAIFDMLIKAGADVQTKDPSTGRTALHFASANPDASTLVDKLLKQPGTKETVDQRDYAGASPLHLAAGALDIESVKLLAAAGADINRRHGQDAATPLIAAARANNTAAIRFLLDNGALARLTDSQNKSALYYAREHKNTGMIQILEQYVQKELNFKQKPPSSGKTA